MLCLSSLPGIWLPNLLTVLTASRIHIMLVSLYPYAVDITNTTNKTWRHGDIPTNVYSYDKMDDLYHLGEPLAAESAIDLEDIYGGTEPFALFPTTSDTLDERGGHLRYEVLILDKKHVSR